MGSRQEEPLSPLLSVIVGSFRLCGQARKINQMFKDLKGRKKMTFSQIILLTTKEFTGILIELIKEFY